MEGNEWVDPLDWQGWKILRMGLEVGDGLGMDKTMRHVATRVCVAYPSRVREGQVQRGGNEGKGVGVRVGLGEED